MNNCHLSDSTVLFTDEALRANLSKKKKRFQRHFQEGLPRTAPGSFAAFIWIVTQRVERSVA